MDDLERVMNSKLGEFTRFLWELNQFVSRVCDSITYI